MIHAPGFLHYHERRYSMKRIATAIVLATLGWAAQAQPYLAAGASFLKTDGESHSTGAAAAGYRFTDHFAAEIGLFQPGQLTRTTSSSASATQIDFSSRERSVKGYRLSALFSMPITERMFAFASTSAYMVEAEFSAFDQSSQPLCVTPGQLNCGAILSQTSSVRRSRETLPALGIGLGYRVKWFSVLAYLERIDPKGGMFGPGNDVDKIDVRSVEFVFSF
jgi:hypothetical protein